MLLSPVIFFILKIGYLLLAKNMYLPVSYYCSNGACHRCIALIIVKLWWSDLGPLRGGAEDYWNFRIWIIQQKVTSHPVSTEPRSSFHKAKKWRFDLPRFSSICNPSGSLPIKLRVGSCCRHIPPTLQVKLLAKDSISLLFWRKTTESLLSSNGGFYTFAKLMLFRLLVVVVRDWVIRLSEIAHDVRDDLDEVLLAMVCTVYNGNIYNRSRFSLKAIVVSELFIYVRVVEKTSWVVYSRLVSYFRISCWILFSL